MSSLYINSAIVATLWGLGPIFHKIVLNDIPPHIFLILSSTAFASCTFIYGIYNYKELRKVIKTISYKNIILILLSGILASFMANLLYYHTLKTNKVQLVTILTSIYPLITIILAYLIFSEKIKLITGIGIFFIISGLGLIAYGDYKIDEFKKIN